MNIIQKIIRCIKPHIAYQKANELSDAWKNSGIWGCGWMPSILYWVRAAKELADYYGLVIKYQGGLSENGPWMNWYAWYPKEKWIGEPKYQPAGHGQGITIGEAIVRCLLDCEAQGLLGLEKLGPKNEESDPDQ